MKNKNAIKNFQCLDQDQPIRGLVFGGKWLEFISQSQIKCDLYNFFRKPSFKLIEECLKVPKIHVIGTAESSSYLFEFLSLIRFLS